MAKPSLGGETVSSLDRGRLLKAAREALHLSYSPYSHFAVSTALLDATGEIFVGANIENAAYPLGLCAERVALTAWRARGGKTIRAAVIASKTPRPAPPCGLCRDALLALAPNAAVYLAGPRGLRGPFAPRDWLRSPGASATRRSKP